METRIYYYSATGNSLSAARALADGLGDAELMSITGVAAAEVAIDTPCTGIVFPVYAWGLPRIVEEFINKITPCVTGGYFFAVATCAGTPGAVLLQMQKLLLKKGIRLNAGFAVLESSHVPLKQVPVEKLVIWLARKTRPQPRSVRIKELVSVIKEHETKKLETSSQLSCLLGSSVLHHAVVQGFKSSDRYFAVDASCKKCGICASVCPRGNLKLENNSIKWNNNCELCFACYNWCPQKSIHHRDETETYEFVPHQDIGLKDIVLR